MLDLWASYENGAFYSDYKVEADKNDSMQCLEVSDCPSLSLETHDVTFSEQVTWLSALRTLIDTKSRLLIHDKPIPLTSVKDSNSTLSLVPTYLDDSRFFSQRLSGVDGAQRTVI
jgi:hypothetical protein